MGIGSDRPAEVLNYSPPTIKLNTAALKPQILQEDFDETMRKFKKEGLYAKIDPLEAAVEACYLQSIDAEEADLLDTLKTLEAARLEKLKRCRLKHG